MKLTSCGEPSHTPHVKCIGSWTNFDQTCPRGALGITPRAWNHAKSLASRPWSQFFRSSRSALRSTFLASLIFFAGLSSCFVRAHCGELGGLDWADLKAKGFFCGDLDVPRRSNAIGEPAGVFVGELVGVVSWRLKTCFSQDPIPEPVLAFI
jgi:hypothetical protein